jgi:hypothetical protein
MTSVTQSIPSQFTQDMEEGEYLSSGRSTPLIDEQTLSSSKDLPKHQRLFSPTNSKSMALAAAAKDITAANDDTLTELDEQGQKNNKKPRIGKKQAAQYFVKLINGYDELPSMELAASCLSDLKSNKTAYEKILKSRLKHIPTSTNVLPAAVVTFMQAELASLVAHADCDGDESSNSDPGFSDDESVDESNTQSDANPKHGPQLTKNSTSTGSTFTTNTVPISTTSAQNVDKLLSTAGVRVVDEAIQIPTNSSKSRKRNQEADPDADTVTLPAVATKRSNVRAPKRKLDEHIAARNTAANKFVQGLTGFLDNQPNFKLRFTAEMQSPYDVTFQEARFPAGN